MRTFTEHLYRTSLDLDELAEHLDALSPERRLAEVHEVPGKLRWRFWKALKPGGLSGDDFVPAGTPPRTFVRHYGKNSLPAFSLFEKRFALPTEGADVAWGYNHSPAMGLVGPGWFVLRIEGDRHPEPHVDYYSVPDEQLLDGPPLQPNTRGISTFVYGNMVDVMRRVSQHVTVGRAYKKGAETENYFLLCREGA